MSKITDFYAKAMADETVKSELATALGGKKFEEANDE